MLRLVQHTATILVAACLSAPTLAATTAPLHAEPLLKASNSGDGSPLQVAGREAEVTSLSIAIQPGAETGWHLHPMPSFAFVIQGTLQVELRDGRTREFKAGESFAEVANVAHNGRNVGSVPVKLLVVYGGPPGTTITEKP
jgi:quercetin dioxygenase-like cupin family protein